MKRGFGQACMLLVLALHLSYGLAQTAADPGRETVDQAVKHYLKTADRKAYAANQEHAEARQTVVADLDGDGRAEIVVWVLLLGPTYWDNRLAVLADRGKSYQVVAESTAALGLVDDIDVKDGLIEVHAKFPAKNDPICCPTLNRVIRFRWDGSKLTEVRGGSSAKAGSPNTTPASAGQASRPGEAWELRAVAGRPPVATVAGPGVVQSLSLLCNEGRAIVALAVRARPPQGGISLSLTIAGKTTSLPLVRGTSDGKLLEGDLSATALPRLLAAHDRGRAVLRINGGLQGKLALNGVAAASRSALQSCYRY